MRDSWRLTSRSNIYGLCYRHCITQGCGLLLITWESLQFTQSALYYTVLWIPSRKAADAARNRMRNLCSTEGTEKEMKDTRPSAVIEQCRPGCGARAGISRQRQQTRPASFRRLYSVLAFAGTWLTCLVASLRVISSWNSPNWLSVFDWVLQG